MFTAKHHPPVSQNSLFQDSSHRMWHTILPKCPTYITCSDLDLPTTSEVSGKGTAKLKDTHEPTYTLATQRTVANRTVHTVILNSSPYKGQFKDLITQYVLVKMCNSMNLIWQIC